MNGFANTILSILLSWIRALIYNIWAVINSDGGSTLYQFFARHWFTILIVLALGGLIVDCIVYLFRWRPYYVWASRWDRMRRKSAPAADAVQWQEEVPEMWQQPEAPIDFAATQTYQPAGYSAAYQQPAPTQQYVPAWEEEPVFDEPAPQWEEPQEAYWQAETVVDFGRPRPEPMQYYRDVQAGFAPAASPEQLYAPPRQTPVEPGAVHPGLDEESFRQNFGLEQPPAQPAPVMYAPVFHPFTAVHGEEASPPKPQNALSRLARRARTLIAETDEDHPLTIRDLQSTVDVSQAFHEPVYPQRMMAADDDR